MRHSTGREWGGVGDGQAVRGRDEEGLGDGLERSGTGWRDENVGQCEGGGNGNGGAAWRAADSAR
jgi:hypothetical protein